MKWFFFLHIHIVTYLERIQLLARGKQDDEPHISENDLILPKY